MFGRRSRTNLQQHSCAPQLSLEHHLLPGPVTSPVSRTVVNCMRVVVCSHHIGNLSHGGVSADTQPVLTTRLPRLQRQGVALAPRPCSLRWHLGSRVHQSEFLRHLKTTSAHSPWLLLTRRRSMRDDPDVELAGRVVAREPSLWFGVVWGESRPTHLRQGESIVVPAIIRSRLLLTIDNGRLEIPEFVTDDGGCLAALRQPPDMRCTIAVPFRHEEAVVRTYC